MHYFTRTLFLPSFSNYRDSAQTHSKGQRRFRCTYVGEREAINRDAYTNMSPMGVVFHEPEGRVQTVFRVEEGRRKCFTRRSNGSRLILPRKTPQLGTIELFNDKDGEIFQVSRAAKEERKSISRLIYSRDGKFRSGINAMTENTQSRLNIFHIFISIIFKKKSDFLLQ